MKSHRLASVVSGFLFSGMFAPTGAAQDPKKVPEIVLTVSPDGLFAAAYDRSEEFGISSLRIQNTKTGEVIWRDPQEDPSAPYRKASFLWSPNGKRVAFMWRLGRSEEFQILNAENGKITAESVELPEVPIGKDAGEIHRHSFGSAKIVNWTTDDVASVVFSGRVQLVDREKFVDYEYKATLTLPEGKFVFLPEKKIEQVKQ